MNSILYAVILLASVWLAVYIVLWYLKKKGVDVVESVSNTIDEELEKGLENDNEKKQ